MKTSELSQKASFRMFSFQSHKNKSKFHQDIENRIRASAHAQTGLSHTHTQAHTRAQARSIAHPNLILILRPQGNACTFRMN